MTSGRGEHAPNPSRPSQNRIKGGCACIYFLKKIISFKRSGASKFGWVIKPPPFNSSRLRQISRESRGFFEKMCSQGTNIVIFARKKEWSVFSFEDLSSCGTNQKKFVVAIDRGDQCGHPPLFTFGKNFFILPLPLENPRNSRKRDSLAKTILKPHIILGKKKGWALDPVNSIGRSTQECFEISTPPFFIRGL